MLSGLYHRTRWRAWPPTQASHPGYTVLVPVPGDLPVFLKLALAVNRRQQAEHRIGTVVIPDQPSEEVARTVRQAQPTWSGPLELAQFPLPERVVLPRVKSPWRNHGVQVVTGTSRARSSHVIFHDADLFAIKPALLDEQYVECADRGLGCLGVSPAWDPWFVDRGRELAATWELCSSVEWLRSFPPHQHMAHHEVVDGEAHDFDLCLRTQYATAPGRIGVHERDEDYVHFNYVISTYRDYQANTGAFVDANFRLLLIRVFIDLFDPSGSYAIPPLAVLASGLGGTSSPVTYPSREAAGREYQVFRTKLARLLAVPWMGERTPDIDLGAFDGHYGFPAP